MPDIARATIEIRPFGGNPGRDRLADEVGRLRASLPEQLQPLLIGPIRIPINDGSAFLFIHDGHGVGYQDGQAWYAAAALLMETVKRCSNGRAIVTVWGDVGAPMAKEYHVLEQRIYDDGDGDPAHEISNFREELEELVDDAHAALVGE